MTDTVPAGILVLGYGNPGRQDDGLGPAFAARVEALHIPGVKTDAAYQLNVEDSAALAQAEIVLLADASVSAPPPFEIHRIQPDSSGLGFSSHSLSPGSLLGMTQSLFAAHPKVYLLAIRGTDFDAFGEKLSAIAAAHLEKALEFVEPLLRDSSGWSSIPSARNQDY